MIVRLLALVFAAVLLAAPAHAQGGKRIALVIGNASYKSEVGRLDNPGRDADLIAGALRGRGFAVTVVKDAGRIALQQAVDRYARTLGQAGPGAVGFFYYSGHGVANPENGRNYIVPVDAVSASDERLWYESVELQQLIRTITTTAADATNVVVFDACREVLALPKAKNLGSGAKGLERVSGVPSTLIAFSTSPGSLAADRDRTAVTGPYATELATQLAAPGIDLTNMFEQVKFAVFKRTDRKQLPWVENGLTEQVFLGAAAGNLATTASAEPKPALASAAVAGAERWGLTQRDLNTLTFQDVVAKTSLGSRIAEVRGAAERGDTTAAYILGIAYFEGAGVAKSQSEMYRWFLKAAEGGVATAQANVGYSLANGEGVTKDLAAAVTWYRRAADQGNGEAMVKLGGMYGKGLGVPRNDAEALAWYRRGADAGMRWGMNNAGYYYQEGYSVPVDYALAMQWYKRAAALDLPAAMVNIGSLYHAGQGVSQDRSQALAWYRKAAELGDADGLANVGWYYLNGWGVARDYAQALAWSRRAVDAGSDNAAANLGFLYEHGYGVAKDLAEAEKWYRLGVSRGNKVASDSLKRMGLTP